MNVAVENDADEFIRFVYHRAATVAADDVCVGNEIELGRQIEIGLLLNPPLRQIERWLVVMVGGALV